MKHLYLLRHGKSDWSAGAASDHDRPLAPRGEKAAALVGELLAAAGQVPDRVLTSTAERARRTAERAAEAGGWACPIERVDRLYLPSRRVLLEEIQRQEPSVARLLVVGHEPTWSAAAGAFAGEARIKMVTAALARLDFAVVNWSEVNFGAGVLAWMMTPKMVAAAAVRSGPGQRE